MTLWEILVVVFIASQLLNTREDLKTWKALRENMETTTRLLGKMIDRINAIDSDYEDGDGWKRDQ